MTMMQLIPRQVMRIDQHLYGEDPFQTLLRLWEQSPHHVLDLGSEGQVEFVLCDAKYLHAVDHEEHYGIYFGDMTFVSTLTPERWIPFVVLHEWAERRITRGMEKGQDPSSLGAHWQAIYGELRSAAVMLDEDEFYMYVEWRQSVERTRYFEIDPEIQEFLADARAKRVKALPVSKWTRHSIKVAAAIRSVGYDAAHDMKASHSDLLLAELADHDVVMGDVFALLAYVAFLDTTSMARVPVTFDPLVHILESEVTRPVLKSVGRDSQFVTICHNNGRTRQSVEAIMRRFARMQHRLLTRPNGTDAPALTHLMDQDCPEGTPERVRRKTGTKPKVSPQLARLIRERAPLGKLLVEILEECRTAEDLECALDNFDRARHNLECHLVTLGIGVSAKAEALGLLTLGRVYDVLMSCHAPLPATFSGKIFRDPRSASEVVEDNLSLIRALQRINEIDDLPSWLIDHVDYLYDGVPWLMKILTEEEEDPDGFMCPIISEDGQVNHDQLQWILDEHYGITLSAPAAQGEGEEDMSKTHPICYHIYVTGDEADALLELNQAGSNGLSGVSQRIGRSLLGKMTSEGVVRGKGKTRSRKHFLDPRVVTKCRFFLREPDKEEPFKFGGVLQKVEEVTEDSEQWRHDLEEIVTTPRPESPEPPKPPEPEEPKQDPADVSVDSEHRPPQPLRPPMPKPGPVYVNSELHSKDILLTFLTEQIGLPSEIADVINPEVAEAYADELAAWQLGRWQVAELQGHIDQMEEYLDDCRKLLAKTRTDQSVGLEPLKELAQTLKQKLELEQKLKKLVARQKG